MEAGNRPAGRSDQSSHRPVYFDGPPTTETKQAFKTSEFWMVVAVIVGILISAALIKGGDTEGTDEFIARQAWLYVAIVTGAYVIGRGLAKAGSRDPYTEDRDNRH